MNKLSKIIKNQVNYKTSPLILIKFENHFFINNL